MKKTLFIAFVLCSNFISAQWLRINNSPSAANNIYFFNSQIGYVLKSDTIFKTIDGGTTWSKMNAVFPLYERLGKIIFISQDTGFVSTVSNTTFAYPASIFMTINGGGSWFRLIGPYDGSNIDFNIAGQNDYYFHVTSQWLGASTDSIFHTINGGSSFIKTGNTNTVLYNQQINNLVVYKDSTTFNQKQLFYRSLNGGTTWNLLLADSTIDAAYQDYQFLNSNDGYVLLYQYNATDLIDSKIYKTNNGGLTWNSYILPSAINPRSIYFTDVNTGYIHSNSSTSSQIYKTIDGGQTWSIDFTANTSEYFQDTPSIVEYFGKLYVLGNTIITNNISTSVKNLDDEKSNLNLYPNPVTDEIKISSIQAVTGALIFCLYDAFGRIILKKQVTEGESINRGNINRGLYFYTIEDEHKDIKSGKLLFQ